MSAMVRVVREKLEGVKVQYEKIRRDDDLLEMCPHQNPSGSNTPKFRYGE